MPESGMKCVLQGTNARTFAKAVQSLAKIGTNLYIEAEHDGLAIRALNSTKSAFSTIKFFTNFFYRYDVDTVNDINNSCKVSTKACLGVFKNMKPVELCIIQINGEDLRLSVQFKCRLETVKNHLIYIIDTDTATTAYDYDNMPNTLTGNHKLFSEVSCNFQLAEELTMEVQSGHLNFKNYVEGANVDEKFMRTQLTLNDKEFEEYSIGEETVITYCLRELRAFVLFAESVDLDLTAKFECGGSPIAFIIDKPEFFKATLVMSSLSIDDFSMFENSRKETPITEDSTASLNQTEMSHKRAMSKKSESDRKKIRTSSVPENDSSSSSSFVDMPRHETVTNTRRETVFDPMTADTVEQTDNGTYSDITASTPDIVMSRPTFAVDTETDVSVTFKDTEDVEIGECIPQSPTSQNRRKYIRTIFSRCFENTYVPKEPSPDSEMFAANSDTEG